MTQNGTQNRPSATSSESDAAITSDLAALGADCRRDPLAIDDTLRSAGIYRDDRAGAEARRDTLARERRVELATMPLTLSHVFAHRVARAAAGAAAVLCALVMMAILADPLLLELITWIVPGLGLGVGTCLMISASAILGAYIVATWIAEWRFSAMLARAIATSPDLHGDLDRLAEGPLDVARTLIRRVDGWSLGLMLGGFTILASVFGFLVVIAGALHESSVVFAHARIFTSSTVTTNLGPLGIALIAVGLVAIYVGRFCAREPRAGLSTEQRAFGHWSALVVAAVIGIGTLYGGLHMNHALDVGHMIPPPLRYTLALGGALTVLIPTTWALLWWRRREHARLRWR